MVNNLLRITVTAHVRGVSGRQTSCLYINIIITMSVNCAALCTLQMQGCKVREVVRSEGYITIRINCLNPSNRSVIRNISNNDVIRILTLLQRIRQSNRHVAVKGNLFIFNRQIEIIDRLISQQCLGLIIHIVGDFLTFRIINLFRRQIDIFALLAKIVDNVTIQLNGGILQINLQVRILCTVQRILVKACGNIFRIVDDNLRGSTAVHHTNIFSISVIRTPNMRIGIYGNLLGIEHITQRTCMRSDAFRLASSRRGNCIRVLMLNYRILLRHQFSACRACRGLCSYVQAGFVFSKYKNRLAGFRIDYRLPNRIFCNRMTLLRATSFFGCSTRIALFKNVSLFRTCSLNRRLRMIMMFTGCRDCNLSNQYLATSRAMASLCFTGLSTSRRLGIIYLFVVTQSRNLLCLLQNLKASRTNDSFCATDILTIRLDCGLINRFHMS